MKISLALAVIIILGSAVIISGKFYPVAWVSGDLITYRTWEKATEAAEKFTNSQAQSVAGGRAIDFTDPANAHLIAEVKRGALNFLIEDIILQHQGKKLIAGFENLSKDRASQALAQGQNLEEAVKIIYGLDWQDFNRLVLLPQARRDTAEELLVERGENFVTWFNQAKKKEKVYLIFVPFSWDGEAVK